ncbi:MAG: ribonuclease Z [Winogradskyella sp.]|nr:ribonuclease Z [Winogradskyella sp.]NNK40894.1 ribonuclease Z [Winogradskyella sp.]
MILDTTENIITITQEDPSIVNFVKKIEASYSKFKNYHLIILLSSLKSIPLQDIVEFLRISNTHRASKKSFVVVSNMVSQAEIPDEIVVVPTTQEAYDIIEMEEMERDLGF